MNGTDSVALSAVNILWEPAVDWRHIQGVSLPLTQCILG